MPLAESISLVYSYLDLGIFLKNPALGEKGFRMEFRSINTNRSKPIQIDGTDAVALMRHHIESALLIADDLNLAMIGVDLEQALNRLPDQPFPCT